LIARRDPAACPLVVLRIPSVLFEDACHTVTAAGERKELDENIQKDWVTPAQFRRSNEKTISSFAPGEVLPSDGLSPLVFHPELVYTRLLRPVIPEHSLMIAQIWSDDDWGNIVEHITSYMEVIDRYYLTVLVYRWLWRSQWVPSEHRYDVVMDRANLKVWTPPLGCPLLGEEGESVCAVNSREKAVLLCHYNGSSMNSRTISIDDIDELLFPILLYSGDDPGQVLDWYELTYGWGSDFRTMVSEQIGQVAGAAFAGVKESVRSRRSLAVQPFLLEAKHGSTGEFQRSLQQGDGPAAFAWTNWGYCQDVVPRGSAPSSLLQNVHVTCTVADTLSDVALSDIFDSTSAGEGCRAPRNTNTNILNDCEFDFSITIVLTTCRRLNYFMSTAAALKIALGGRFIGSEVQEVIVIDDSSSTEHRLTMLESYPEFSFIYKDKHSVGHAHSLNVMAKIVTSRYLLYLEDDWKYHSAPLMTQSFAAGVVAFSSCTAGLKGKGKQQQQQQQQQHEEESFSLLWLIRAMVKVIASSSSPTGSTNNNTVVEPIAQLLFNDQGQSACARGLLAGGVAGGHGTLRDLGSTCQADVVGKSGWQRSISVSCEQSALAGGEGAVDIELEYLLHEFGLAGGVNVSDVTNENVCIHGADPKLLNSL
jgi:hypothetical protein